MLTSKAKVNFTIVDAKGFVFTFIMSAQVFFKWFHLPLTSRHQLWFTTWLADEFGHGFSCFVWYLEGKMATMDAIWLFSLDIALPATSWLPACPHAHPTGVLVVLVPPVKISKLSKMTGNSASYPLNSWLIDRLWIAIESWQISFKCLFSFSSCNT